MSADQWITYIGRFHPLVVHLPIGILFIVFILEFPRVKKGMKNSQEAAITLMLGAGSLTALFSCIMGWMLSWQGLYDEDTILLHQLMGIVVTVVSGICWSIKRKSLATGKPSSGYRSLLIGLFIALMLTGHYGGSMTHGDNYLTAELPQPFATWHGTGSDTDTLPPLKPIGEIREALVYEELVTNVFIQKCYDCHSAKKTKGGLRLDDVKLLFKGGKHGPVIEPGKPDASELFIRVLLPEDDDKRMPPRKKNALTPDEIRLLEWWIQKGALTQKRLKEVNGHNMIVSAMGMQQAVDDYNSAPLSLSPVFDKELPAPDTAAIRALTELGILVSPVAQNKHLLEISCVNYNAFNDSKMPLLLSLAEHIVSLKMDHTAITDASLTHFKQFSNLVRLNIAGTQCAATGIEQLKTLSNLEYLNIVGTKANNDAFTALLSLPSIRKIYCWNTEITAAAARDVMQQKPGVVINTGSLPEKNK